jgi:predicted 3-demethylubiquinone-9 3-methyltransferase (glyoxalase superfamily)
MLQDERSDKGQRVFAAIMQMKKIDIAALQKAFAG